MKKVGQLIRKEVIPNEPIGENFPFPFKDDIYRYSNNAAPHESGKVIEITPEYVEEIELKEKLLTANPDRCFQAFDYTLEAQWEILELVMGEMVTQHSNYFSLEKDGDRWTFTNHLVGEMTTFTFGDVATLPYAPLDFIGRQVQEDLVYLGQRDGDLYMDAGQLCFPANWSIAFDAGMNFLDIHSPVPPAFTNTGLAEKVQGFIMRIEAGKPWTRFNWTMTVDPILDTFPETYNEWGKLKTKLTDDNIGQLVNLRVEDQRLFRLPRSNGILFSIHTYFITIEELCENEKWKNQIYSIMTELPDYLAEYKGFISYKDKIINYLQNKVLNSASAK